MVYDIKLRKDDLNWKVGKEEAPKHLKLLRGLPGLNNNDNNMYVTVECFLSEGLPDEKGNLYNTIYCWIGRHCFMQV